MRYGKWILQTKQFSKICYGRIAKFPQSRFSRVFYNMEQSQIIRLPKKYKDLIFTLSNEEAGILLKKIFWLDVWCEWMVDIYHWIIKSDLDNLEKSAVNWWKWWRPKKETTGYENKKPQVIENDNLKERERERESKIEVKDKEKDEEDLKKIIDFWNTELNRKYEITLELKEAYRKIKTKHDREIIENVILEYIDKCKKMDKQYHLSPFKFFTQKNWFITIKNS